MCGLTDGANGWGSRAPVTPSAGALPVPAWHVSSATAESLRTDHVAEPPPPRAGPRAGPAAPPRLPSRPSPSSRRSRSRSFSATRPPPSSASAEISALSSSSPRSSELPPKAPAACLAANAATRGPAVPPNSRNDPAARTARGVSLAPAGHAAAYSVRHVVWAGHTSMGDAPGRCRDAARFQTQVEAYLAPRPRPRSP